MPSPVLKNMISQGIESESQDPPIMAAIDFMFSSLESLGQAQLASRLTINCSPSYVEPHKVI